MLVTEPDPVSLLVDLSVDLFSVDMSDLLISMSEHEFFAFNSVLESAIKAQQVGQQSMKKLTHTHPLNLHTTTKAQ